MGEVRDTYFMGEKGPHFVRRFSGFAQFCFCKGLMMNRMVQWLQTEAAEFRFSEQA
jgi:hypothetical protein